MTHIERVNKYFLICWLFDRNRWTLLLLFFFAPAFPYLGSAPQVFNLHVLRSCASSIFTCFSFMSFLITSLHLCFAFPIFLCPPTSISNIIITNLLQSFAPHGLTISVSLLSFSHLCLPHLSLFIFLHSRSSQSSLFSSSISTFSFLFFLTSLLSLSQVETEQTNLQPNN